MFADEEPTVNAGTVVAGDETALGRITRFFRLGQADLERDFHVSAMPVGLFIHRHGNHGRSGQSDPQRDACRRLNSKRSPSKWMITIAP